MTTTGGSQDEPSSAGARHADHRRGAWVGAAANSYDVAISFVSNASAAHGVVAEVTSTGHRALAVRADNARPEEVAALFSCIDQEFARTDVPVNNAAIVAHQCRVEDAGFKRMQRIFAVNSIGPCFVRSMR